MKIAIIGGGAAVVHPAGVAVVVMVDSGVLPLGHHSSVHGQAGRVVVLVPCADALHRRNDKAHNDDGEYGENENLPKAEGRVKTEAKSHRCSPPAYVKYIPITLFSGAAQPSSA